MTPDLADPAPVLQELNNVGFVKDDRSDQQLNIGRFAGPVRIDEDQDIAPFTA
jgi:hypothetical protein